MSITMLLDSFVRAVRLVSLKYRGQIICRREGVDYFFVDPFCDAAQDGVHPFYVLWDGFCCWLANPLKCEALRDIVCFTKQIVIERDTYGAGAEVTAKGLMVFHANIQQANTTN